MNVESFSVLADNMADLAEKSNPKQSFFPLFCHLASDLLITYLQLCIVNYEL